MKRHILLLFIAFIGINAMAQEYSSRHKQVIDICGSRVYEGYTKLDKYSAADCFSSINGVDRSDDYLKYRTGYKTGLGLMFGGAALTVAGFYTIATAFMELSDVMMGVGVVSLVGGSLSFVAGIPTTCIYKAKLNRLERRYNKSLEIGTSGNGLSMAIKF